MKRIILSLAMALLSLTTPPLQAADRKPEKPVVSVPDPKTANEAEARILISRLNEINSMDKSRLSSSIKKKLRNEVRSIRLKLNELEGGIYLSGAAIIIIIVLLIILL